MGILLSLDLGTEGARVGAFTTDGKSLGSKHEPYTTSFPRPGWAEQNPSKWWASCVKATHALLASESCRNAGPVISIASATTASTVAILDANGSPIRPAILWMDSRASREADATAALATAHQILANSGGSDAAEWLLPKAMWLSTNDPQMYQRAARIVEAVDFITFKLTGRWVGSQMNAVCKYNYDTVNNRFPLELYAALGVPDIADKLPDEILPVGSVAGSIHSAAADELGISRNAVVAVGGIDAHVSLLACGAEVDGLVSVVSGTSTAIITEVQEPEFTSEVWGPYPKALRDDRWLIEGGQVTSGSVLKWVGEGIMGVPRAEIGGLIAKAAQIDPGEHGLLALDYFMGNRTPHRDPRLRGAVIGLTLGTSREELYRAAVEGVACGTKSVLDSFARANMDCRRLVFSGGMERNALWQQVTIDVLGREAEIVSGDNLTLRACAVIAAKGAGLVGSLNEGAALFAPTTTVLTPNVKHQRQYEETYANYVELTDVLQPIMQRSVEGLESK